MKNIIKIVEFIFWIPFAIVGFLLKEMHHGMAGGWEAVDYFHKWLNKKVK